jgi:hypothetical protein
VLLVITAGLVAATVFAVNSTADADSEPVRRTRVDRIATDPTEMGSTTGAERSDTRIAPTDDDWQDGVPVAISTMLTFAGTWVGMIGAENLLLAIGLPLLAVSWLCWLRASRRAATNADADADAAADVRPRRRGRANRARRASARPGSSPDSRAA